METKIQQALKKNTESKKHAGAFNWNVAIQKEFRKIWETRNNYDFKLLVGPENTELKAHRVVLSLWSSPLSTLLANRKDSTLVINDFTAETVNLYLQFAYTGEYTARSHDITVQVETLLQLLKLAEGIEFKALKNKCAEDLQNQICIENALGIFQTAFACVHEQLKKTSLQFICRKGSDILGQPQLLTLSADCLELVIKQHTLSVKSELEVFKALLRWGTAESSRRSLKSENKHAIPDVIQPLLKYVCFTRMNYDDFKYHVLPSKVLSHQDTENVLLNFLNKFENTDTISNQKLSSNLVQSSHLTTPENNASNFVPNASVSNSLKIGPNVVQSNPGTNSQNITPSFTQKNPVRTADATALTDANNIATSKEPPDYIVALFFCIIALICWYVFLQLINLSNNS